MIRDARLSERQALEDLQRRASLMWDRDRPFLLANPDVIELPLRHIAQGHVRVAEDDGRVLGFAVLLPRDAIHDELDGLFVEPAHWGRGIGGALLADALSRAAAPMVTVVSNHEAEGFYRRQGFAVTGVEQTQFGPALRLEIAANRRGIPPA